MAATNRVMTAVVAGEGGCEKVAADLAAMLPSLLGAVILGWVTAGWRVVLAATASVGSLVQVAAECLTATAATN